MMKQIQITQIMKFKTMFSRQSCVGCSPNERGNPNEIGKSRHLMGQEK